VTKNIEIKINNNPIPYVELPFDSITLETSQSFFISPAVFDPQCGGTVTQYNVNWTLVETDDTTFAAKF
jgi:hypothetical protein